MFKKTGIVMSCSNWQSLHSGPATSRTSSIHPQRQECRSYAMISNGHSRHNHGKLRWPEVSSANAIPTPYQIFNQKKGSPYSKRRFYELVKLYHPDRHDLDSSISGLSIETKTERYRLVVAANDILSDPIKRGAYDCFGAGWNGLPDVTEPRDPSEYSAGGGSRGWHGGPRGPSQNATWEDWERWYQRDSQGPQEPKYVSNTAFVGLILTFAVLGGIGQATRVGNYSMSFLEQRDALHDEVSKDLIRRRKESTSFGNKDDRIHNFLKSRDPITYRIVDSRGEAHQKLLPAPEVYSSGDLKSRQMDAYHRKDSPKGG